MGRGGRERTRRRQLTAVWVPSGLRSYFGSWLPCRRRCQPSPGWTAHAGLWPGGGRAFPVSGGRQLREATAICPGLCVRARLEEEAGVGVGFEAVTSFAGLRLLRQFPSRGTVPEPEGRSRGQRRSGPKTAVLDLQGGPSAPAGLARAWQAWGWLGAGAGPRAPHRRERNQSLGGGASPGWREHIYFLFLLKRSRKRLSRGPQCPGLRTLSRALRAGPAATEAFRAGPGCPPAAWRRPGRAGGGRSAGQGGEPQVPAQVRVARRLAAGAPTGRGRGRRHLARSTSAPE